MTKNISRKQKYKNNKNPHKNKTQKQMTGGGQPRQPRQPRDDFLQAARSWVGKGTYVMEGTDMQMIINNDSALTYEDEYIPPDFLIKFANYGQYKSVDKLYLLLSKYSESRYEDKSFAMNCWQFVLLCLLESKYLTEKQIAMLYMHFMNNPIKDKRIPDYFGREYSDVGEPGDIILFKKKDGLGTIWHTGILTKIDDTTIEYIHMLGYSVGISTRQRTDKILDEIEEIVYIKPENLIAPIIKLVDPSTVIAIQPAIPPAIKPAIYDKTMLRNFLVNIYFKKEIFDYASEEWKKLIASAPGNVTYFEKLFESLDPTGYAFIQEQMKSGTDYTFGDPDFYEKHSKSLFFGDRTHQDNILEKHNLLDLVS